MAAKLRSSLASLLRYMKGGNGFNFQCRIPASHFAGNPEEKGMSASTRAKRSAFDHVIGSINDKARFPEQVFRGRWDAFLFFESDHLFAADFSARTADLLNAEQAEVCCLLNFSETATMTYDSAAMRFITADTSSQNYDAMLRQGGAAQGWLFGVDRYGCSSDRGGWSIYCEKQNDIAVIALREPDDKNKYATFLKQTYALPITELLEPGAAVAIWFKQMRESWRRGLTLHYSGSRT